MKVVSAVKELEKCIKRAGLFPVGLVPTMGALHDGHLSLVRSAKNECPQIIVSIYVNPTQFNDKEDLKKYPRTPEADLALLGKILRDSDIVFTPADEEMYPEEDKREFHFGNLDRVMEALHRPGHFNGVAQIVSKLFEIVDPERAYFGLKDLQQVAVIKDMVRQKGYKVKIIPQPIIREPDGLAMSSRNRLLEPDIRKKAPVIHITLKAAAGMIKDHDIPEIKQFVKENIEKEKNLSLEYFEIADENRLMTVQKKSDMKNNSGYYGCIAVKAGKIRLIDNIEIPLR